jgi:predicted HicB family RNase H-like nuclease
LALGEGGGVDKNCYVHFMPRIDPKLHKALAIKAAREGRSLNAFVAEKLG